MEKFEKLPLHNWERDLSAGTVVQVICDIVREGSVSELGAIRGSMPAIQALTINHGLVDPQTLNSEVLRQDGEVNIITSTHRCQPNPGLHTQPLLDISRRPTNTNEMYFPNRHQPKPSEALTSAVCRSKFRGQTPYKTCPLLRSGFIFVKKNQSFDHGHV